MCVLQLIWQPGAASVSAGRSFYSNAAAVGIAFLLLAGRTETHIYWVQVGQHLPTGHNEDSLATWRWLI